MKEAWIVLFLSTVYGHHPATLLTHPVPLLTLCPRLSVNNSLVCQGREIVSCEVALVNWDTINNFENIILPTGEALHIDSGNELVGDRTLAGRNVGEPQTLTYSNSEGSKATLTYTKNTLYGQISLSGGRSFKIESLSDMTHVVWAEVNLSVWKVELEPVEEELDMEQLPHMRMEELMARGSADNETVVEYSVTVYYTKEFKAATTDPKTFIEHVIQKTNEGYINSKVPIRARLHCVMESDVDDGLDASTTLTRFKESQDNLDKVRMSADAAILLVKDFSWGSVCGLNYFNTISSGKTLGTVRKGCALGYLSFGHEMAHGFGLHHDRRVASHSSAPYAFGYIVKRGLYRTIMAYNTAGEQRVNYLSNPGVLYQGSPTGDTQTNNARRLSEVRFAVAEIGDESLACAADIEKCEDRSAACPEAAMTSCWYESVKSSCPSSCGLCPGMAPQGSTTCYNKYTSCDSLAMLGYCYHHQVASNCLLTCGGCV